MGSGNVVVLDNPYLKTLLCKLRDRETPMPEFRRILERVGEFVAYEICRELPTTKKTVKTPLDTECVCDVLDYDANVLIVSVLRASIPFVNGMLKVIDYAEVGFVAAKRVEEGNVGPDYAMKVEIPYIKLPNKLSGYYVIIADPMFATGSTMLEVISKVKERGEPKKVIIASVIATEVGVRRVLERYPDVRIYTLAVDPKLNQKGFIVPGLGDAGDRAFGM